MCFAGWLRMCVLYVRIYRWQCWMCLIRGPWRNGWTHSCHQWLTGYNLYVLLPSNNLLPILINQHKNNDSRLFSCMCQSTFGVLSVFTCCNCYCSFYWAFNNVLEHGEHKWVLAYCLIDCTVYLDTILIIYKHRPFMYKLLANVAVANEQNMTKQTGTTQKQLWTFPHHNCHSTSKVHVQQILNFVCYIKAKTFSNDCMPRRPKFLIHALFDHFCCHLQIHARVLLKSTK